MNERQSNVPWLAFCLLKHPLPPQLTLADIILFEGTVTASQKDPTVLDKYPTVKGVAALVADVDGIKQYLAKRAKTDL